MADEDERVCLARISEAHGLAGEVRLKPFTEVAEDVAAYGLLEDETRTRRFEITKLRPARDALIVRFAGVDGRAAAEALRGLRLYVDRERLPAAEQGTWYHADLIGLDVLDPKGAVVGSIVAVQNYGAGDLLEIRPADGRATELVPFTSKMVPDVDLAAGRVVVDVPEGFLD